jgi:RNA-directed DNA polymerase
MLIAYREVKIPKASGGFRTLSVPEPELMAKQREILRYLTCLAIPAGPYLHAYVRRRSIRTAALAVQPTRRAPRYMIKADVKNFFPSLTREVVLAACRWVHIIPKEAIEEIDKYCFCRGVLPQGAPTSPFLSNLVMKQVGARMGGVLRAFAKSRSYAARMAFYCDNITITGEEPGMRALLPPLRRILGDHGLKLNNKKTRIVGPGGRKDTCGVVVSEKLSPRKEYWRLLRAQIHNAVCDYQAGRVHPGFYVEHIARTILLARGECAPAWMAKEEPAPVSTWRGRIAFVASLNPERGAQLSAALLRLEEAWKESTSS